MIRALLNRISSKCRVAAHALFYTALILMGAIWVIWILGMVLQTYNTLANLKNPNSTPQLGNSFLANMAGEVGFVWYYYLIPLAIFLFLFASILKLVSLISKL